jgi:hypothetical protein
MDFAVVYIQNNKKEKTNVTKKRGWSPSFITILFAQLANYNWLIIQDRASPWLIIQDSFFCHLTSFSRALFVLIFHLSSRWVKMWNLWKKKKLYKKLVTWQNKTHNIQTKFKSSKTNYSYLFLNFFIIIY